MKSDREIIFAALRQHTAENISCCICGKLLAYGEGDLNVTTFICPICARMAREDIR